MQTKRVGSQKDDDVKGSGVQYDYGFRIYDARIARFLSVDPLTAGYPMLTPYQYGSNRPIDGVDLDGLEWIRYQYLPTADYGMAFIHQETQETIEWKINNVGIFWSFTQNIPVPRAFILEHGFREYIFGSFKEMSEAVKMIDSDYYYESLVDGIPGLSEEQTLGVLMGAGEGLAWLGGNTGAAMMNVNIGSALKQNTLKEVDTNVKSETNKGTSTGSVGWDDIPTNETISVYHKGNLTNGQVSGGKPLSTGLERSSVEALNRSGTVHQFDIPKNVYDDWLNTGKASTRRDYDFETCTYNNEVRFGGDISGELNKYKKPNG